MVGRFVVALGWLFTALPVLSAQDSLPAPSAQFVYVQERDGFRFRPSYPPLVQMAGAPDAFYTSYWEFGDGHYSFEETPWHAYPRPGEYEVLLCGTAHYDDNKKPPKPTKKKVTATAYASTSPTLPGVFTAEEQSIALRVNRQPVAQQELFCIISYRNRSVYTTDGRLHLFFNERRFPTTHFQFLEARTHFGEVPELLSVVTPPSEAFQWAALTGISATGDGVPLLEHPPPLGVEEILQEARRTYRNEQTWRFSQLRPGESRNAFVTLQGTPTMLRDTSAHIHILGVFAPSDSAIPVDTFELELEIVNSHDPNAISVSDNRMNFRRAQKRALEYRVRFQNTGEGPAKTVQIAVKTPKSLDMRRVKPLDWYPSCPICIDPPQPGGCLDTAVTDTGLVFTFRNIYLPGTRQKDCSDKDSTKGFVRYRIHTAARLPKLPFYSQAAIVFDKNVPVITNRATTRFKPGISPGVKVGYGFYPDSTFSEGYYFAGVSFSPYRSWRVYPQVEVLTGVQARTELPEQVQDIPGDPSTLMGDIDTLVSERIVRGGYRQALSFELPVLLRHNGSFIGGGIGASAMLWMSRGEDEVSTTVVRQPYRIVQQGGSIQWAPVGPPIQQSGKKTTEPFQETRLVPAVFGDLTVGSVRSGPHLGLRMGWRYTERWHLFAQLAAQVSF